MNSLEQKSALGKTKRGSALVQFLVVYGLTVLITEHALISEKEFVAVVVTYNEITLEK